MNTNKHEIAAVVSVHWYSFVVKSLVAAEPLWVIRGFPKIFENFDLQIPEKRW
jgi:hypothetical protein